MMLRCGEALESSRARTYPVRLKSSLALKRSFMLVVRRALLSLALALPALPALAQGFPDRPLRLVVPFEAGGGTDIVARVVAEGMRIELNQPVVVMNRGGAGTVIGSEFVAKSTPDGYTLLYSGLGLTFQPALSKNLPYDVRKDFLTIAITGRQPNLLIAGPSVPTTSLQEIVKLAKAKPGALTYGTAGQGSGTHIASDMLWQALGIQLLHVPYRGTSPALNDLTGGRIDLMFTTMASVVAQVQGGNLRGVGVSSLERSPMLPGLPTIAEQGAPGFEYSNWASIVAPAGTPPEIVTILADAINRALQGSLVKEKLAAQGVDPATSTPAEAQAFFLREVDRWTEVIAKAGIQAQ